MLTVARLVPHKGIDVGIEALACLKDRYPDLDYLVIGDGPDRTRLEALAETAGLSSRVLFRPGVPDRDLPGIYGLADLYLGLSREEGAEAEGFGIALADAAATAVAVVAGRSGGTAAAVKDGETGLLVTPTDVAQVAGVIDALLADPDRRASLGAAGRRWVTAELNWARAVAALAELSRSAARPGRR
jgi:phosphatidylinositol alpha-1,6-mannosyltransferase